MKKQILFIVFLILLLNIGNAQQDIYKNKISISYGYAFDATPNSTIHFTNNTVFDLNYQRVINSTFSFELSAPYYVFAGDENADYMFLPSLNFIIHTDNGAIFNERAKISPYLRIGLGKSFPNISDNSMFHINTGLGFKFRLSDRWNIFAETNYVHFLRFADFSTVNSENLFNLKAGVSYNFGKKSSLQSSTFFYHSKVLTDQEKENYIVNEKHQAIDSLKAKNNEQNILSKNNISELDSSEREAFIDTFENYESIETEVFSNNENPADENENIKFSKNDYKGKIRFSDGDSIIVIDLLLNDTIQLTIEKSLFVTKKIIQHEIINSDSVYKTDNSEINKRIDSLFSIISDLKFQKDTLVIVKNIITSDTVFFYSDTTGINEILKVSQINDSIELKLTERINDLEQKIALQDSLLNSKNTQGINNLNETKSDSVLIKYDKRISDLELKLKQKSISSEKIKPQDTIIAINKTDLPDNTSLLKEINELQKQIILLKDSLKYVPKLISKEEKFVILNYTIGSSVLMPEHYRKLKDALKFAQQNNDKSVYISGYSDKIGNQEFNLLLSKERAVKVKNFFITNGIESERIFVLFYGETKSISENNISERRVEILLK